ncbi:MAG: Na(+)/H(+) antiporter subunit D [Desulfobacteraceae bacterium]|nr:MAG: Na(+)/H(+) antiporter subunit D [Desulfobacteraceae bacterium]
MISLFGETGLPPSVVFMGGAFLIPLIKGRWKSVFMLLLPLLTLYMVFTIPEGNQWVISFLDHDLILGRIDRLSRIFSYIFLLISFIAVIFSLKIEDDLQYAAGFAYAGGALGVTFAGDLFSLYIFWEIMAIASTFLIIAGRTQAARSAAFRYIMVHIFGGLSLLAGIVLYVQNHGTTEFSYIGLSGIDSWLIFLGIAVNAAIPPLHPWLSDAYPEATVTGAVFLSAFTTKSAVYVMARTFPGTELLIWIGALMTIIPIFYAEMENDIRRVLAYSLINQVGFMMCGIGIGTQLALNGTVSHAFCHILYKALLFMSAGAVLHMTGKSRCTDLGGLYKTMPLTCMFCIIGAASISAFPLFSGFVSKSMILSAAAHDKMAIVWLLLLFSSAGVTQHAGIKVPFFLFFGHDSGIRVKEPPVHMMIAMGIAAFLCIFLGVRYDLLYSILPYEVDYLPYTEAHVMGQLQLLLFGALAFCLMVLSGYYLSEIRAINLDTDWFYRKGGRFFHQTVSRLLNGMNAWFHHVFAEKLAAGAAKFAAQAPVLLVLFIATPIIRRKREDLAAANRKAESIRSAMITLSVPIGISAAAAALFFTMLFLFMHL